MQIRTYFAVLLLSLFAVSGLHAQTGVLSLVVRDSKSHNPMQAKVRIEGPKTLETETDKDGNLTLSLPTGEYKLEFAALGYITVLSRAALWGRESANPPAEILLIRAFAQPPVSGGTGVLRIEVRNAVTGQAVPAKIEFEGTKSLSIETDGNGSVTLPSGEYLETVSAPGYKAMWRLSIMVRPGSDNLIAGAMLVPLGPRPEEESERSQLKPGHTLFVGYATDEQGHPMAGVRVRLKDAGAETTTNEKGYYSLSILTPPEKAEGEPATDTLIAEKNGYKTIVHYNVEVESEGPKGTGLDMERGTGVTPFDDLPMAARPTDEHQNSEPEQPPKPSPASPKGARESSPEQSPMTGIFPLPVSIKVGLGCLRDPCQTTDPHGHCYHPEGCNNYPHGCAACRFACPNAKPFNLEYYVQQGLQSEWRAIWGNDGPDSLKAGAVAYRTYAAYFQEHPGRSGSPNYDIRSDECQQAFKVTPTPPDSRTSAAAQATTGVALSQDGTNAYFSEYAANTNAWDGCQEGYTGDNTSNWPCMPDPIATLSQGSGHGRGMSQYGSWWWARGESYLEQYTPPAPWQCILDHYYNDNGNSTGAGGRGSYRYSFLYGSAGAGYGPSPDGVIVYVPLIPYLGRPLAGGLSSRTRRIGPADDMCGPPYADLYTLRLDGTCPASDTCPVDITPNKCNQYPAWAPTQKQIVHNRYTSDPAPWAISIINFDGTDDTPFLYDWPWLGQDWSLQNVIVYNNGWGLYSINPDGSNGFQVNSDQYSADPSWSPGNGPVSLIAYDTCVGAPGNCSQEIFVINANGGQPAQLTSAGNNWAPSWSPDSTRIVYLSDASGSSEVWVMNSDGSYQTQLTFFSVQENLSPHWSQDGHYILWLSWNWYPAATTSLKIMSPDGTNPYSFGPVLPAGNAGGSMDTTRCRKFDSL